MKEFCPICKGAAETDRVGTRDIRQYDCKRCGKFEITGTALAILPSRFEVDEQKSRARLSHSIRSMKVEENKSVWPEVNTWNLDDLVERRLPSIEHQTSNLLSWIANQLEDDQLGSLSFPDDVSLAGLVGTIDGNRVSELFDLTDSKGLIEIRTKDEFRMTEEGWQFLEHSNADKLETESARSSEQITEENKVVRAHCNCCRGERKAYLRATYTKEGSDNEVSWSNTYDVLECCGCENIYVRHQHWFSEWDSIGQDSHGNPRLESGIRTTYWPPPTTREKPHWVDKIEDGVLRRLVDELFSALNSGLVVLSAIGARTSLDRASFLLVEDPPGGFEGKLKEMKDQGYISDDEKKILEAVTDAGSASAHRGYAPKQDKLMTIIDILENFIERTFVLKEAANELKRSTPPRPRRSKMVDGN